jgi:UDP-N-acetylglucosamine transferase subunit ALG13
MSQGITAAKPRILVAPLDWGLGHATRVIPIIRLLLERNCTVIIAAKGRTRELLEQEFPDLEYMELEGYGIQYSRKGWMLPFKIAAQVPHILSVIKKEHQWLQHAVADHSIDAVISDNRYGLYHHSIPTVLITHQLRIKTGLSSLMDRFIQQFNYQQINKFVDCWVPDHEKGLTLAGELSHPTLFPSVPVKYIGPLSRFTGLVKAEEKHLLVILSGPEPQRTLWEEMIIHQLHAYKKPVILVRGLPGTVDLPVVPLFVQVFNHLPAQELDNYIQGASFVISRCGYSTIMDVMTMQKKSILVPTPRQAEQEYLAEHLMQHNLALCIPQSKFRLAGALDLAAGFPYEQGPRSSNLNEVMIDFLTSLDQVKTQKEKTLKPGSPSSL